jgi:hypothetical protein
MYLFYTTFHFENNPDSTMALRASYMAEGATCSTWSAPLRWIWIFFDTNPELLSRTIITELLSFCFLRTALDELPLPSSRHRDVSAATGSRSQAGANRMSLKSRVKRA